MNHTPKHERRSSGGSWLVDAFLWVAAAAGVVCITLVILAHTMGITLIMFSTGSMSPTIPPGSVAVVQGVDAADIEVGDVVTVDREGLLPVTHRVTSIEPGSSADERIITMRGDANEQDDPHPYEITSARTVLWSVPGLAKVIVWFGEPLVLGGITIGAALLVGWAFWPKDTKRDARAARHKAAGSEGADSAPEQGREREKETVP